MKTDWRDGYDTGWNDGVKAERERMYSQLKSENEAEAKRVATEVVECRCGNCGAAMEKVGVDKWQHPVAGWKNCGNR